ncbi:MAG: hypothetical protein CMP11_06660 [Zetaproteobacteria bacterium]|nr:hypothetical protein [Pseudobdellovibrionaceae bacterium]|tara:strand:+ start:485 stop:757 length:273 start_codon:yes stop_codon:yes gene_type:complete
MEQEQAVAVAPEKIKPNVKYSCFIEAHKFAKGLSLKSRKEWRAWAKGEMPDKPGRPLHVPAHPDGIYKIKGWQGWKHWLGTAEKGLYENS